MTPENIPSTLGKKRKKKLNILSQDTSNLTHEEKDRLAHELQVHQVELETQNEQLQKTQLALEAALDRYRDLYDFAPVGYLTISEDGLILEANLTITVMLGVERAVIKGQHFSGFIDADSQDLYYHHRKMISQTRTKQTCELVLVKKDGAPFYARLECVLAEAVQGGTLPFIRTIITDVSETRKANDALKASESKFRVLADHTYDWEYWIDKEGKYVYLSSACERITGYSSEEFISDPEGLHKIVHPDYAEKVRRHYIDENNPDFSVYSMTFPIFAKNGKQVWLEHNCAPVYDDQGTYAGRRGNNRDITGRKTSEDALRSIYQLHESIVESSPVGIALYTSKGKCIAANRQAANVTGGKRSQMLQQNYHHLESWKNSGLYEIALEALKKNTKKRHEISLTSSFGKPLVLDIHLVPTTLSKEQHLLILFDDITDKKKAEQEKFQLEAQYRQAQKMESVGRLAGGVAHDFNNALSVITGFSEMALTDLDPKDQLHEDLSEILTAARRAAGITRQLLAFARKQTISPVVLDFNKTLEGTLKMLRRLIGEDIDLAWMPGSNLWSVKMDPSQMDQVLANLCVNARDAIQGVGRITIESKNITFNADYCRDHPGSVPGQFVQLTVSDTGCGMDKATQDNIFEPFFTTKKVGMGTGLGLATVYGIIKQNNGFINVYSEPDQGTTINIHLPRQGGKADERCEDSTEQLPSGQGETILIVEDALPILKIMEKTLKGLGYAVLTSSQPEMVMDMVRDCSGQVHLLITDVIMPKMNGRDLADQLKSMCPDLDCIFMSGYTADVITHKGVLAKGENFLQKPFSRKDLARMVRKVLDA